MHVSLSARSHSVVTDPPVPSQVNTVSSVGTVAIVCLVESMNTVRCSALRAMRRPYAAKFRVENLIAGSIIFLTVRSVFVYLCWSKADRAELFTTFPSSSSNSDLNIGLN